LGQKPATEPRALRGVAFDHRSRSSILTTSWAGTILSQFLPGEAGTMSILPPDNDPFLIPDYNSFWFTLFSNANVAMFLGLRRLHIDPPFLVRIWKRYSSLQLSRARSVYFA